MSKIDKPIHTIRLSGDFLSIDQDLLDDLIGGIVNSDREFDLRVLRDSDVGLVVLAGCVH